MAFGNLSCPPTPYPLKSLPASVKTIGKGFRSGKRGEAGWSGSKRGSQVYRKYAQVSTILMVIIFLCLPPPDFLSTHHRHILTTDNNHKHYNYTMGLYNFIRGLGGGGGERGYNQREAHNQTKRSI